MNKTELIKMVTKKEAKKIIKNYRKEYSERAAMYGQGLQKEQCKHLTKDFICDINNEDQKEGSDYNVKNQLSYCVFMHHYCNLANGNIKLKDNEYTKSEEVRAGKVFVNNKGVRFTCLENNNILCPRCNIKMQILSFCFGIVCHKCNKQIH